MGANFQRESRHIFLCIGLGLFSSCASPATRTTTPSSAEAKKVEAMTLDAEITRKDGKIKARLIHGTGTKEIDDAILTILESSSDNYQNLKEGESTTVQVEPLTQ